MNHQPQNHRMTRRTFLETAGVVAGAAAAVPWLAGAAEAPSNTATAGAAGAIARGLRAAEDRARSPFTGYTRAHWLEITERLLAGVLPHIDPATGNPRLKGVPGDRGHAEGFKDNTQVANWQAMERIMMLAVYYTAATGRDQVPGWNGSITEPFRNGILHMSDPGSPMFCQRTGPSVYMGSETALGIMLSPRFFWDPFTDAQRQTILNFIEALAFTPSYDNNHHLFHMLPASLLDRCGKRSNRDHYAQMLERTLGWYRGDGWILDGNNRGLDHYNWWGFQLYINAVCKLDRDFRERFGARFAPITRQFLLNAPYFYGRDGGSIAWGRSLTYRFADVGAIAWAHLNGADPLPPGLARRMASGCLKYFWDRGAMHDNGVMETGWLGANAIVGEDYVTDGTGYFAAQGLACLLIPEDDPFWTAPEQPMPADPGQGGGRLALPGPQMVVRVSPLDGETRMFPVGQPFAHPTQWQRGIKYCQHSYSSDLGWCALGEGGEDLGAGRSGFSADGQVWTYRAFPVAAQVTDAHAISTYPMLPEKEQQTPGAAALAQAGEVTTHTLIGDAGELHVFWHDGPRPVRLYLGGYGINVEDDAAVRTQTSDRGIHLQGQGKHSLMEMLDGPAGRFASRVLQPRTGWRHSHVFGGHGAFVWWESAEPVAARTPVAIFVDGARGRVPRAPAMQIRRAGSTLEIEFEGRQHKIALGLPAKEVRS